MGHGKEANTTHSRGNHYPTRTLGFRLRLRLWRRLLLLLLRRRLSRLRC